ncbi:MAG: SDR family oxidoreductase [Anaerolineaceae bacterium]|nr:SDR family oxidoreductase [Anaerolineaceae bacterium]
MKTFENKLALVTGGSSGIGLGLAKKLAASGANVWILARRSELLNPALKLLEGARQNDHQQFGILQADVSDPVQVTSVLSDFIKKVGTPDLLINSAGIARPGLFQELDLDIFRAQIDTNYLGTIYVTKAIITGMIQRGSGHIVNISSAAGFLGVYGYTAYGPSKYAVRGFSDVLRAEMKPLGIKVTVVFPSDVETPQLEYENQFKPAVTYELSKTAKTTTPEIVADITLKGVLHDKYVITVGSETTFLYHLSNILGNLVYPVMDMQVSDAIKKSKLAQNRPAQ